MVFIPRHGCTFLFLFFIFFQALAANSLKTPDIGANALFLYRNSNFSKEDTSTTRNGIDLQEAEVAFSADVDPYSKLQMLFTSHPQYTLNRDTNRVEEKWQFEPEELFAESTQIPYVIFKLGKFKAEFGKHNNLHTHAFPFVDAPLTQQNLLGDEGLNDVGVSAAVLLPVSWFSEVTLQYLRGEGENQEFNSPTPGDGVQLVHWKNLWDLHEDLTMELGGSYAQGANSLFANTFLTGVDLTFKWRPSEGGRYHSWIFGLESMQRRLEQPGSTDEKGNGYSLWGKYQFAERWAVLARYENLKIDGSDSTVNSNSLFNDTTLKGSVACVFEASEFSSYRLEYDGLHGPAQTNGEFNERKIYLQAQFVIGSHPSHSY